MIKLKDALAQFSVGNSVQFTYKNELVRGIIERVNRKTVSIYATNSDEWRVSPQVVSLIPQLSIDDFDCSEPVLN